MLAIGLGLVLLTMFMWWRDIVREAEYQGHHTPIVQVGMRYGMMLFIASEVMFFVAFFWAFFDRSFYPAGGVWPPEGIETFNPFDLPLINTLVLLLSGCTVTWSHHALVKDNRRDFHHGFGFDHCCWARCSPVFRRLNIVMHPLDLPMVSIHLSFIWQPAFTAFMFWSGHYS